MVAQAEAVATAVLAGGVAGATDDREVQSLGAFAGVLQGNGDRAADATRDHHGLVLANEARGSLHRAVGLGFGVADHQHQLLPQNALLGEWRNLTHARVAIVYHLGGELETATLACAFGGVRTGQVKREPCRDGVTRHTGRIVAQCRILLLLSPGVAGYRGQHETAGDTGCGLHECTTAFGSTLYDLILFHCMPPWVTTHC